MKLVTSMTLTALLTTMKHMTRKIQIAALALSRISLRLEASCAGPLNEIVTTCRPRVETSFSICSVVMP